jgi:uncharacterized membrane protein YfcA
MALNVLFAPEGCITFAIALVVPTAFMADCAVLWTYYGNTRWDVVRRLLPPTMVGVAVGVQLLGEITANTAKLMIGFALMFILAINLGSHLVGTSDAPSVAGKGDTPPPAYATSTRFAVVVGLLGGFATILTNSMGPLLNVYLLAHRFDPKVTMSHRTKHSSFAHCTAR